MSHLERQGMQEVSRSTDAGPGFLQEFTTCFEDVLKDVHKVQCEFLNSKPAEAHLPKAEISNDGKGEFITFAAMDQQSKKNVANFDQWLDNKTKLKPQAA